jgi:cold shock protein
MISGSRHRFLHIECCDASPLALRHASVECAVALVVWLRHKAGMRSRGTVKFFDKDKGFGFITPDEGGRDVFVHVNNVQKAGLPYLEQGMVVSYEPLVDNRGRGAQATILQLHA